MARVTVEDCVEQIPNRFELVMLAAHRARALGSGAELTVERDRDKNPVVSLREIAEQKLDLLSLEDSLVRSLQKRIAPDSPEEEVVELMAGERQDWVTAGMENENSEAEDEADEGDDEEDLAEGEEALPADASLEEADTKD